MIIKLGDGVMTIRKMSVYKYKSSVLTYDVSMLGHYNRKLIIIRVKFKISGNSKSNCFIC